VNTARLLVLCECEGPVQTTRPVISPASGSRGGQVCLQTWSTGGISLTSALPERSATASSARLLIASPLHSDDNARMSDQRREFIDQRYVHVHNVPRLPAASAARSRSTEANRARRAQSSTARSRSAVRGICDHARPRACPAVARRSRRPPAISAWLEANEQLFDPTVVQKRPREPILPILGPRETVLAAEVVLPQRV
jgi:hypothetical protein